MRLDLFARDSDRAAGDLASMRERGLDSPSTALMAGMVAQAQGDKEKARVSFQMARDVLMKNELDRTPPVLTTHPFYFCASGAVSSPIARPCIQFGPLPSSNGNVSASVERF